MCAEITDEIRRKLNIALKHRASVAEKIRYRIKPIDLRVCYSSLSGDHVKIGFFDFFVENDVFSFKQNLYTACQLQLAAIEIDSYQKFTVPTDILYALLSDSPEMIEAMATLAPSYYVEGCENPLNSEYKVRMWQFVLQGDYAQLEAHVDRLAKSGSKADKLVAGGSEDFFSLLMQGRKQELESLIRKHAAIPEQNAFMEGYVSGLAILEAKVCWSKGIRVQIDHPRVPMDLMPVNPLTHYEAMYDFLAPDWTPPTRGVFVKLSRIFAKNK